MWNEEIERIAVQEKAITDDEEDYALPHHRWIDKEEALKFMEEANETHLDYHAID